VTVGPPYDDALAGDRAPATARAGELASLATHPDGDRDELIMSLERDQFVAETSRPLPRATLTPRMVGALWGLRIFVTLVGLMVIYTFIAELQ